ncbi:MAG: hypothetical protein JWN57_396 [Frankiales bacterium]|jgi:hypothetical protein|nr:hypothetical protein [Frankiales bacterium]
MSEQSNTPDAALKGAGLSATGRTADQLSAGDPSPGTTYGDPGGTGTAESELHGADGGRDASADASGDVEGAASGDVEGAGS